LTADLPQSAGSHFDATLDKIKPMRFDIVTIFPEFFGGPLGHGIVRRARESGLIETRVHDLRDFTHDRHRTVDDRPFGGGEGMVMKPEPIFEAVESILGKRLESEPAANDGGTRRESAKSTDDAIAEGKTAIVLLSAAGKLFDQETARRFAQMERIVLLCGRYEGVDERVAEHLATDEISIGDFVLSGGELPATMILDAVTRLIPGALGNEDSTVNESFSGPAGGGAVGSKTVDNKTPDSALVGSARTDAGGLERNSGSATSGRTKQAAGSTTVATPHERGILDYPHYTRPQTFRGWEVPQELMSGNHEEIRRWRQTKALEKTRRNRPELLSSRT
jgi:tRNA (guanine37-N1)-methyltransferase